MCIRDSFVGKNGFHRQTAFFPGNGVGVASGLGAEDNAALSPQGRAAGAGAGAACTLLTEGLLAAAADQSAVFHAHGTPAEAG